MQPARTNVTVSAACAAILLVATSTILVTIQISFQAEAVEMCAWRGGGRPKCVVGKAKCLADEKRISVRQRLGSCPQVLCCKSP
jgi:hypothetical protein